MSIGEKTEDGESLFFKGLSVSIEKLFVVQQITSWPVVSDTVVQCLSLLHSFAKQSLNSDSVYGRLVKIFDNDWDRLIY